MRRAKITRCRSATAGAAFPDAARSQPKLRGMAKDRLEAGTLEFVGTGSAAQQRTDYARRGDAQVKSAGHLDHRIAMRPGEIVKNRTTPQSSRT